MRHVINGRVVGHRLFTPDPKNAPGTELVRVDVDLQPVGSSATDKNTRAVLVIDPLKLPHFPLKQYLRFTIEDSQQVLPLAVATAGRKKDREAREGDEPR